MENVEKEWWEDDAIILLNRANGVNYETRLKIFLDLKDAATRRGYEKGLSDAESIFDNTAYSDSNISDFKKGLQALKSSKV